MHPSRKPLMAGNWKMTKTVSESLAFVDRFEPLLSSYSKGDLPEMVLCAPFTALDRLSQRLSQTSLSVALGAQTMAAQLEGAYTGETSARMLTELNVAYVVLGHSERREYYGETDKGVNAKIKTALENNLKPIVCVGESLTQRDSGETDAWVTGQVRAALEGLSQIDPAEVIFAYEPIWAIGTGKVCEAPEANRVIGLIRQTIGVSAVRILYGGSMKPDNVQGLLSQAEIDGGLVGGASLEAESFLKLVEAAVPQRIG